MATTEQQALDSFTAGTSTETVTQTVVLDLETSATKNEYVQQAVDEFQTTANHLAARMPSVPKHEWSTMNSTLYRIAKRGREDTDVYASIVREAMAHVTSSFKSARELDEQDPRSSFGKEEQNYAYVGGPDIEIVENDRGYGIKPKLVKGEDLWFHVDPSPHQRDYLERICDGDASYGTAEFRLEDDGSLYCHLPVKWDVDVYDPADLSTRVGVDIGENVLYAAAVVSSGTVDAVEMESGREFRHYRTQLEQKRSRLSQQGDLNGVRECRGERRKYTEQVLDTASREIVDLAVEHRPAAIQLEDLKNYRETADDPIHDWPYAEFQEKIMHKATAAGIPAETVSARNTSVTCRKCGQTNREYRDGPDFHCTRCGYEVHADVNAAINLANRE